MDAYAISSAASSMSEQQQQQCNIKLGERVPITSHSAASQQLVTMATLAVSQPPQQQQQQRQQTKKNTERRSGDSALPSWPLEHRTHDGLNAVVLNQLREIVDAIGPTNAPQVRQQAIVKLTQYVAQYVPVKLYVLNMSVFKLLEPILCLQKSAHNDGTSTPSPSSSSSSTNPTTPVATTTPMPPTGSSVWATVDFELLTVAIKLISECAWNSWTEKNIEVQKVLNENTKVLVFKRLCILTLQCPDDKVRVASARALWNLLYNNSVAKSNFVSNALLKLIITNILTQPNMLPSLTDMCIGMIWAMVERTPQWCQAAVDAGIIKIIARAIEAPPTHPTARIETYFLCVSLLNSLLSCTKTECAALVKKQALNNGIVPKLLPLFQVRSMTIASVICTALGILFQDQPDAAQSAVRIGILPKFMGIISDERCLPCIGNIGLAVMTIICTHPLWSDSNNTLSTDKHVHQQQHQQAAMCTKEREELIQQADIIFKTLLNYFILFQRKKPCITNSVCLGHIVACIAQERKHYKDIILAEDGLHCMVLLLVPPPELSPDARQFSQNSGLKCLLRITENHSGLQHAICTSKFKKTYAVTAPHTVDAIPDVQMNNDVPIPASAHGIYDAYFFLILRCIAKPWAIVTVVRLMTQILPGHSMIRKLLRTNHVDYLSYILNALKMEWSTSSHITSVAPFLSCLFVLYGGNDPAETSECKMRIAALMNADSKLAEFFSGMCRSLTPSAPTLAVIGEADTLSISHDDDTRMHT